MALKEKDFIILDKFQFDIQPVAVKYFVHTPLNIKHINRRMTLCQMLRRAQKGEPFYSSPQDHTCDAGLYVLGQTDIEEQYVNGEFGAGLGVFCDNRAASRLYHYIPHIARNVVNYVAFSPLNKLSFDPDLLVILASTSQAEILLRAMSYKNGQMWLSRYSAAIGCSWLLVHPYLNGEMNFIATGLGFGMRRRKLFRENMMFISIPFDRLSSMLETLREMPWIPEPYKPSGLTFVKELRVRLGLENEPQ
jgi:uncharacterized protein (DUF169 family)